MGFSRMLRLRLAKMILKHYIFAGNGLAFAGSFKQTNVWICLSRQVITLVILSVLGAV